MSIEAVLLAGVFAWSSVILFAYFLHEARQTREKWKAAQCADEEYWQQQIRVAVWLNRLTLSAALVGLAGLVILRQTLKSTNHGVEAAQSQVAVMRDQFRAAQRPWVVLDQLGFDQTVEHSLSASIKNIGGGPALDVDLAFTCSLERDEIAEADLVTAADNAIAGESNRLLSWPSIGKEDSRSAYVVAINATEEPFPHLILYCFGAITYKAADDSSHESRFARKYNPVVHRVREAARKGLPEGQGWVSNSFDATEFKVVGGTRLNYAN